VSALATRRPPLGYLSEWHFKSLTIEMPWRGSKTHEPQGTPLEPSRLEPSCVVEPHLASMRDKGMPRRFWAHQLRLSLDESRGFFLGLAPVSGGGLAELGNKPQATFRVVKWPAATPRRRASSPPRPRPRGRASCGPGRRSTPTASSWSPTPWASARHLPRRRPRRRRVPAIRAGGAEPA
jgi:hypothetical protein